jgi:hypothetical protein
MRSRPQCAPVVLSCSSARIRVRSQTLSAPVAVSSDSAAAAADDDFPMASQTSYANAPPIRHQRSRAPGHSVATHAAAESNDNSDNDDVIMVDAQSRRISADAQPTFNTHGNQLYRVHSIVDCKRDPQNTLWYEIRWAPIGGIDPPNTMKPKDECMEEIQGLVARFHRESVNQQLRIARVYCQHARTVFQLALR